jgi:hypothetical protein
MNRNNEMLTVSVTSVCIHQNKARLLYKDCVHEREVIQEVNLEPSNEIAHA